MPIKLFVFISAFLFLFNTTPSNALDAVSWNDIDVEMTTEFDCAQKILADALAKTSDQVSEDSSEYEIEAWIYRIFQDPDVIRQILDCKNWATAKENDFIVIPPIEFSFAPDLSVPRTDTDTRTIIINYTVTKKILNQRLLLAGKAKHPGGATEKITFDGTSEWVNTDPAWYAIMIVRAGVLDNYVGKDKNNTISLKYMLEHQADFFPHNSHLGPTANFIPMCTSGSAFANDNDIINISAHKTQNEKPSWFSGNDYYVAGDVNLQWVTWAEVAGDVALTVASLGAGAAVTVGGKALRTGYTAKRIVNELKVLRKLDKVKDFNKASANLAKAERVAKDFDKVSDIANATIKVDDIADLTRGLDGSTNLMQHAKNWKTAEQNAARLESQLQLANRSSDVADIRRRLNAARQDINRYRTGFKDELVTARANKLDEIKKLKDQVAELEKLDDVKKYKTALDDFGSVKTLSKDLKAWRTPQRGNVITRMIKTLKAERGAAKTLGKAGHSMGRAGSTSGRLRDGLFKNTLKLQSVTERTAGAAIAAPGVIHGIVKLAGEFYDWTNTSTYDYTSNLEFKPFALLSADDLDGQDNVVNRGMWLMWSGDSIAPEDDDAAFLLAMNFAQRLFEDIVETQDAAENNGYAPNQLCDIDIYVVRPVIRNPGVDNELYYLIMNDIPWQIRR